MAKVHQGFNLLRDQLREADKWDKIQNWVNGTARVIVIFVEFIVIVCFGARIFMDRVARNLETRLDDNKQMLQSLSETEIRLRQLQIDLQNYKGLWENSGQFSNTIETVYAYVPSISNSITLSIDNAKISISGTASKENIGALEGKVKSATSEYQDTLLERYSPDGQAETVDTQGQFTLTTSIKNYKRKLALGTSQVDSQPSPTQAPTQ
jgi:hypothetical protein